jgi:hypothetical protein
VHTAAGAAQTGRSGRQGLGFAEAGWERGLAGGSGVAVEEAVEESIGGGDGEGRFILVAGGGAESDARACQAVARRGG